jgi:VWFA-related protein
MNRVFISVFVLVFHVSCSFAQNAATTPAPVAQSPGVLRANTRLVVVDLVATQEHGGAVADLKQEDFTVTENGVPQKIATFNFWKPAAHPQPVQRQLPPGVISNSPAYGAGTSYNVILLDAINTDFSSHAYAQDSLIKYLETNPEIQPTAVYAMEGRLLLLHDFTTDTRALRDVVAGFKPQGPTHIPTVDAAASPFGSRGSFQVTNQGAQVTYQSMRFIARALAGYPGRKNLIWISEGFPFAVSPEDPLGDGSVISQDTAQAADQIANELMNAQVALYPIDAAGVSINDRFGPRVAMVNMAARTGGKTFYNRNDIEVGVRTSIDDGSTYYSLSYYPTDRTVDSKFRKIQVKVARPGVKLQYREGYFALPSNPARTESQDAAAKTFSNALLLEAPAATGVLFQAAVLPPSEKTQNKIVVNFGVDPHTVTFQKQSDGLQHAAVSCVVWAYPAGKKGDPVMSESNSTTAALTPENFAQMMSSYFPCQRSLSLKPGSYNLKLGVVDRTTDMLGTMNTTVTVK